MNHNQDQYSDEIYHLPIIVTERDIQMERTYMEFYNDIHLFDWLTIAENAKQIHTMETSLCYLLEKIGLTNVHVYSKYTVDSGIDDFNYIKSNYSDEWTYVR